MICLFYRRYIFYIVFQEAINSNVIKLWSTVYCYHLNYMLYYNMVKKYNEGFEISSLEMLRFLRKPCDFKITWEQISGITSEKEKNNWSYILMLDMFMICAWCELYSMLLLYWINVFHTYSIDSILEPV